MPAYSVGFKPSVEKDLRPLPQRMMARVWDCINALKHDPFPRQSIKLSATDRLYRIRVGDYRIIYEVDTAAARITIHCIRHRKDVYR